MIVTYLLPIHIAVNLFRDGLSLTLEPRASQIIRLEEVLCLGPDLSVVVVYPLKLSVAQKRWFDQVTTDGSHGNVLEA